VDSLKTPTLLARCVFSRNHIAAVGFSDSGSLLCHHS
jgi:hypothetical protein